MADNNWTVEGRTFRTQHDYIAGCRDKKKIDQIRSKIDFQNREAVLKLQRELQKGNIQFDTMIGTDFKDEVDELAQKLQSIPIERKKKKSLFHKDVTGKHTSSDPISKKDKRKNVHPEQILKDLDDTLKKEVILEFKKRERYRKALLALLAVVAAGSLSYFIYYNFNAQQAGVDSTELSDLKGDNRFNAVEVLPETEHAEPKPIINKYKTLYQMNKKLIGWVKIADTDIDYPVMQTDNETYYLDHNFEQEKDRNGSIFMDPKCDAMTPSTNLIIYGHNMRSGKMFGTLNRYEKEEYYQEHKMIQFDTIYQEGTYEVMYAFRSQLYKETDIVFKYYQFIEAISEEEFNSNMREMQAISLYDTGVTASYGDQLLTLSTCDYNEQNGRFVVVAKRVE